MRRVTCSRRSRRRFATSRSVLRRWTLVLDPRGKIDALARIRRTDDQVFVLDTDAGFGEALLARISRFKIRVDAGRRSGDGRRRLAVDRARARPNRRRVAADGHGDRARRDDSAHDGGRPGLGELPEGVLSRPGTGRADGFPRRGRTALAAHRRPRVRRRRRRLGARRRRQRRGGRHEREPATVASGSPTSSVGSTSDVRRPTSPDTLRPTGSNRRSTARRSRNCGGS